MTVTVQTTVAVAVSRVSDTSPTVAILMIGVGVVKYADISQQTESVHS
jgi:hypothetical protein